MGQKQKQIEKKGLSVKPLQGNRLKKTIKGERTWPSKTNVLSDQHCPQTTASVTSHLQVEATLTKEAGVLLCRSSPQLSIRSHAEATAPMATAEESPVSLPLPA